MVGSFKYFGVVSWPGVELAKIGLVLVLDLSGTQHYNSVMLNLASIVQQRGPNQKKMSTALISNDEFSFHEKNSSIVFIGFGRFIYILKLLLENILITESSQ